MIALFSFRNNFELRISVFITLTVKFQKSWPPKFQAGSLQPKVLIARNWHVTWLIWPAQVIPDTFKPSMPDEKEYFRFIAVLIFHFRFERISPKGRKENFRGSLLKHFWETTTLSPGQGQIKGSLVLQNQLEISLLISYGVFFILNIIRIKHFL